MSGTPVRKTQSRRFLPRKSPPSKRKRRAKPPVIRVPPVSPVLKKYVIPYLPYALFFWLGSKLGQAYRLTPGTDMLKKLAGSMGTLNKVISSPPSIAAFDLFVGVASAVIIYALVYFKKKKARKYRKDIEYGSARWGSSADIKPFIDPKPENNVILTATESITMNSRPASPKFARNKNIMVIGGSGSGKTRFFVTPNIMQCQSKKYPVSFVVTDPKGGIMDNVGTMLVDNGYEIKVLNTVNFARSMRYNPFAYIRSEKDILKLVNTLIANTTPSDQKSSDPFWVKSETLLYCALIGFIHFEGVEKERNLNTLVEMINAMETKEDNEDFKNPIDVLFDELEDKQPQHFAVRQYRKFKLAAGKTSKSILISCGARLAPFDIKEVRDLMAADDLELDTLGDRKTALFVIISDTDDSFNFIVAMMYSQMFNLLCDKADNEYNGKLPVHVRCLLDEFANIGQIPKFDKLIATIRSREISACVILQAQSQLKTAYKDNAETIIGNCDAMLFLGGKEKSTLEDLSKALGKETIDTFNNSVTRGNSPSYGQNYQKVGKDLMTFDELAVMDGGKCVLQLRGVRPFLSNKYDITKHPNYRHLAEADDKNAFSLEKYLKKRLKVKPGDVYEVYEVDVPDED